MTWQWSNGATIGLDTCPDAVTFRYRWGGDDGTDVAQRVTIIRTPCHYGGSRPWFACPSCRRLCAILYLAGRPKCRCCARLVYPSQSEDAAGRSWQRTRRILQRLGQAHDWPHGIPCRPEGMRRATFERLWQEWLAEEDCRDALVAGFLARMAPHMRSELKF